jgi:hypothetical protein
VDQAGLPKMPFALRSFLGKNMTFIGFHSLYFAGAGFLEPLGSRSICFQFWHRFSFERQIYLFSNIMATKIYADLLNYFLKALDYFLLA